MRLHPLTLGLRETSKGIKEVSLFYWQHEMYLLSVACPKLRHVTSK